MISAAGLELTNLLNPDLTWKNVTKGNRSATRRSRKPSVRNLMVDVEPADNNGQKRTEDTTVSESEKLGVAVLGRRFSEDVEHVPIKKRKFNFPSSSPPLLQTPSDFDVIQHASDQRGYRNANGQRLMEDSSEPIISHVLVDGKISDSVKENLNYSEDFSGIEILAAAACGSSLDADVEHPEEKLTVEGCLQENNSKLFVEEAVAPLETANCPSRDTDRIEDASVLDTPAGYVQNSSSETNDKSIEKSLPSRLHWDLNVVMDAWEEPGDIVSVSSLTKDAEGNIVFGSEEQHILEDCKTHRETTTVKHDNVADVVSSKVHEKTHISTELRVLADESDREDNQLEACSGLNHDLDECGVDPKDSLIPSHLEEKKECRASNVNEDEIVPAEIVQGENYDFASHKPAVNSIGFESERSTLNVNDEDSGRVSCFQDDANAYQVMINMDNCELPDPVEVDPACKPKEVVFDHPSPKCGDVAISSESAKESPPMVTEGAKVEVDSTLHIDSAKLSPMSSGIITANLGTRYANEENGGNAPSNSSCKISFEESCDDNCLSDTSHDNKVHTVCMENSRELQDGYDSQFEDGELRETDALCWEENNCDGEDIEQVDYESECEGERLCIYESEDIDNKRKFESGSSLGSGEVTVKSELGVIGDSFVSSEAGISGAVQGNNTKKVAADCEDESGGKVFTSRMVGARASRREFLYCDQGSLSSDVLLRSDNVDDLCLRSERQSDPNSRSTARDRFSLPMHHRSAGGNHIVNTRPSPPYYGHYGSGKLRPRSVVESREFVMTSDRGMLETTGREGFDSRERRQYMSSSSNSVYQPFNRRSLGYRDDIYTGMASSRDDINPDRSRFRRYPHGFRRGFREDFRRPMLKYPNDDYMPQRMGRRDRSISPLGERSHYVQSYKKPRSRSRSRSPNVWFSTREQIEGSKRRCSRSPDFRSSRINRVREPFKKHFEVEYEEGFTSPPRNRFSPQRKPPRFSGFDNFRDRKSPVRMFQQDQRFDSSRPFRPLMPRRFPDMGVAGTGSGYKYEGGEHDDRRKWGNRYEVYPRARHYDNDGDGVTRRLRYNHNSQDSFVANES